MPQLQLPIFPADVTPINQQVAVSCESGKVVYVHGLLPVFQHERGDLASFRLFTSQMIAKPISIKSTGGKSGGCASKAVELQNS